MQIYLHLCVSEYGHNLLYDHLCMRSTQIKIKSRTQIFGGSTQYVEFSVEFSENWQKCVGKMQFVNLLDANGNVLHVYS